MTNKLHTSLKTQEIFSSLGQSLNLQPFILSKLAIALSIRKGELTAQDFDFWRPRSTLPFPDREE